MSLCLLFEGTDELCGQDGAEMAGRWRGTDEKYPMNEGHDTAEEPISRWRGTDEKYPMNEGHDTAEEPILTGYLSSVPR
jgi:hypothetical protein